MLLEVGMKLYGEGFQRLTITRVTAKRAYAKLNEIAEWEFDREVGDGLHIYKRGNDSRFPMSFCIETPELLRAYKRHILEWKFSKIDVKVLSDEQLNAILAVSNNVINPTT